MTYACLFLPWPPTVNNLFVNNPRTRGRFPSKAYKAWQEDAGKALLKQAPLPEFKGPVSITFTLGRPDKRRRDAFNYIKAPEDLLVKHGILEDDSLVEKGTVQWSPHVFGVRIEIEPFVAEQEVALCDAT
jgi:Holliday junction resolvase RusA-like endonuclease